jgi:hypothetical protein
MAARRFVGGAFYRLLLLRNADVLWNDCALLKKQPGTEYRLWYYDVKSGELIVRKVRFKNRNLIFLAKSSKSITSCYT